MAQVRHIPPGYEVIHPNREKLSCKLTRLVVVLILLASVAAMLVLMVGGWSELQGMRPLTAVWCLVYLVVAVYIGRWARGLLPIAAALGVLMLLIAVIVATGLAGTSWSDRSRAGFLPAQSLFGGVGLDAGVLSLVTIGLIPVELLLVAFALVGFAQRWNVELEVPLAEGRRRGTRP